MHEHLTIKMEATDDVPSDDQGIEAASLTAQMQEHHLGMKMDDVPPVDQEAVDAATLNGLAWIAQARMIV